MSDYDPIGDLELIAGIAADLRCLPAHLLEHVAEDIKDIADYIVAVDDHCPGQKREAAA